MWRKDQSIPNNYIQRQRTKKISYFLCIKSTGDSSLSLFVDRILDF